MSIATLKRKTIHGGNSRLNPVSGNNSLGFAVNGTKRIGPQIGPNLPPHTMINNRNLCTPENSSNKASCINDSNVIKTSVKNTRGMLASRCMNSAHKDCIWVQTTTTSQRDHIFNISRRCFVDVSGESLSSINSICKSLDQVKDDCEKRSSCKNVSRTPIIGWQNRPQERRNFNIIPIAKRPSVAISSGEYLRTKYLYNHCIPIPRNSTNPRPPWPPPSNNNGCRINFRNFHEYQESLK